MRREKALIHSGKKTCPYFNYYAVPGNTASLGVFRHRLLVQAYRLPSEPEKSDLLDTNAYLGQALAS